MHVWPGVTPTTIRDTPYDLWCQMAAQAQSWLELSWGAAQTTRIGGLP